MQRIPDRSPRRVAVFHTAFRDDLRQRVEIDRKLALRALDLVEAIVRDPFAGIGKPEPLRGFGADAGSRRLSREHRLVYLLGNDRIDFLQARFHY